jgi:MFS transporter, SET family, sugar efflux transporter
MLPLTANVDLYSGLPTSAKFKFVCACVFLNALVAAIMASSLPIFLTRQVHATYSQTGAVIVLATLVSAIFSHQFGNFTDRSGRRVGVAILSAMTGVVGFIFLSLQTQLLSVALIYVFLISCASSLFPQFMAMAFLADRERVPVARAFASLGWVVGPPLGGLMITMTSYAALFQSIAGIFLLIIGLMAWMPTRQSIGQIESQADTSARTSPEEIPAGHGLLGIATTLSAIHVALALPLIGIPLWVIEVGGTEVHSGYAFGLAALIEIPVLLCTSWLKSQLKPSPVFVGCAFALSIYLALLALTTGVVGVVWLSLINGVVTGLMMGFGIAALQDAAPTRPGFTSALYTNILRFSYTGAVFAVGFGADHFSIRTIFQFGAICVFVVAVFHLVFTMKRSAPRRNHD